MRFALAGKLGLGAAVLALAGCGGGSSAGSSGVSSAGFGKAEQVVPYKAKLTKSREEPRDFTVTVEAGTAGLDLIRESARYHATRYCLTTYGQSDADWVTGPDGDWLATRDGMSLSVSGRCTGRG